MRFIGPLDEKPFYGVAVAALAGLMLGGSMKPVLRVSDGPEGPQMLGPVSGPRAQYIDSRSSFGGYRYGIPDWVIGTDWLKSPYPQAEEPPVEEPQEDSYEMAAWEQPQVLPAVYAEPEPEPAEPTYPSLGGDILHGVGVPPPPEPPAETEPETAATEFEPPPAGA
jgi:hypothetical protein